MGSGFHRLPNGKLLGRNTSMTKVSFKHIRVVVCRKMNGILKGAHTPEDIWF